MSHLLLALANERPLISFDATLLINIGLWVLLFVILRSLLWQPMVKLIAAREGGTEGSRSAAKDLEKDAKDKRAEFEAAQKKARAAAQAARDAVRNEATKREGEILSAARAKMNEALEVQRAEIKAQRETLETELRAQVPQLAKDIASKALGREVAS